MTDMNGSTHVDDAPFAMDVNEEFNAVALMHEGFARIERQGHCDVYIVQNHSFADSTRVSLAFPMDDFDSSDPHKSYGEPLVLNTFDRIDFLGDAQDYFVPKAPLWEASLHAVRMVPKEMGLLPVVRALEQLRQRNRQPTDEEMVQSVRYHIDDYRRRRALLVA